MADSFVQVPPDSTGKQVATNDIGGKQYQVVNLADDAGVSLVQVDGATSLDKAIAVGGQTAGGVFKVFETNASGHLHVSDGGGSLTVDATSPLPISAAGADHWPGYTGAEDTANQPLHVDQSGALVTRGAVTTDEGTFRCNFANTSYALSIGSVTVSGTTVTGSGFLAADVHFNDYFKISADAETAWVQIFSIVSDTEIQLVSAYVGSASGTGQRSLLFPLIGSGGSLTVGSGQLTIASGTTANANTGMKRLTDYAPLVFRSRCSISQRIVNQETHIGLEEDAAVTRWFARFVASGTTATSIICETGRNPSGAPTASETESTTVTLPNGATTTIMNDYRVELLTESVRFYINSVLVAEHVRVLPHQHDPMTSHVEIRNGATPPASTTSVVLDYITGKNHNKLEVGVMSDVERIVAAATPLQAFNYSVVGVIAINTDLISIDCLQLRSLYIQCSSMGTTGTVTVQWSNTADFAAPITATLLSEAGATATTITAAGLRITNVVARYCRLRLTVATTAGTTTFSVWGAQTTYVPIITTQPVSGTVTATSNLAAGVTRAAFVAAAGIWYDDSSTNLAIAATFTGTSRDLTVTATATAMANAATYAQELRVVAESDVTGTLWLEVSRDNAAWRRIKSLATTAVTGGGFAAEIVHRPSWRYARVGFTNGAVAQARFAIGSFLMAS